MPPDRAMHDKPPGQRRRAAGYACKLVLACCAYAPVLHSTEIHGGRRRAGTCAWADGVSCALLLRAQYLQDGGPQVPNRNRRLSAARPTRNYFGHWE